MLGEKEKVDAELTTTKSILNEKIIDLAETEDKLADANYKLIIQEEELIDLGKKVENQADSIRSKNSEIDTLRAQLCEKKTQDGEAC